ncbi:MAG: NAD-dependent epimerase/dehydratase family protein [Proteobacteria bacterium]|nr:NAD-dependent epimerase/dehydratase family protein [Pseudomonadota bacterium]
MTTLVTGASGFVGSAVARRVLAAGHRVRVLLRPESDRRNLEGLEVEVVHGDLLDPDSLKRAVKGCETVFHVAADYRLWVPKPEKMYAANVQGSVDLARAAADAGVTRIVYTSSVATLGLSRNGTPSDEETPSCLEDMIGHYKRSKFLAEAEMRRLVRKEGLPIVIVNPSTPVGPRDVKPTPTGRLVLEAAAGRMPAYVDTGLNLVHVDDVAEGHLLALERGRVGERYVLGGTNMSLREILAEIADIAGITPPKIRLSTGVVLPIAYIAEGIARLSGREPRVTVDGVRMARKKMYYSAGKAARELGLTARPVREALADAVAWFRDSGYC